MLTVTFTSIDPTTLEPTTVATAGFLPPDDHFVGRRTDRASQVGRHDLGIGNLDGARNFDLASVDVEFEIGRGIDLGLGHIRDPQVGALDIDLSIGQGVAPFETARGIGDAGAEGT